ncbi:hypothetical protein GJAV_G00207040, partial [Gymnothorax javanicus]
GKRWGRRGPDTLSQYRKVLFFWASSLSRTPRRRRRPDVTRVNDLWPTHVPRVICWPQAFGLSPSFSAADFLPPFPLALSLLHDAMSGVQILALLGGLAGLGATIAATVSNEWKTTSRASSVITATWVYQGLWMNCGGNAMGAVQCREHLTIFQLDGYIQVCRGLMISAVCLGFFGAIFALIGMKCTKIGGSDKTKAKITCLGGFSFILSGLCSLTACSLYAHRITSEFFDPMFIAQKFELGAALFIGWAGSVLCILGGGVFCCSLAEGFTTSRPEYAYTPPSYVSSRPKTSGKVKANAPKGSVDYSDSSRQFGKNAYV